MKKKTKILLQSSAAIVASASIIGGLVGCTATVANETISIVNDLQFETLTNPQGNPISTYTLKLNSPITLNIAGCNYLKFNVAVQYMYWLNGACNVSKANPYINNLNNIYTHQTVLPVIINNQTYIMFLTK